MGSHKDNAQKRMVRYYQGLGRKLEAVHHKDPECSWNVRNMWATGAYQTYNTPRIVGKSQKLAWRNDRKNAHPPFVNRSGRARSLPMA